MSEKGWFVPVFPARTGGAVGKSVENEMLNEVGGGNTIRTRIKTLPDGSAVMLRTRAGMPEFTVTKPKVDPIEIIYKTYMESGQLGWSFPGEQNPTRYDPATWHFLDVPTSSDYLGEISLIEPVGAQSGEQVLTEGMGSLAIGYLRDADAVKDEANKTKYSASTVMKKLVVGYFPSSLFSGRMREFMQAQYGARELVTPRMTVSVIGESSTLSYTYKSVTIGLSHRSDGIFTASDSTFWLIKINRGSDSCTLTAYPIIAADDSGKQLFELCKVGGPNVEKLRSYFFAHSVIDTTSPVSVGTSPCAPGFALAYGWKWNSLGTQASIVVHDTVGSGSGDMRWSAATVHLNISYDALGQTFSLESEVIPGGEWTDGWGAFNIFVPENDLGGRLQCMSIAMDTGNVHPEFDYSGVPVYGLYLGDVWTPVTMSRVIDQGPFPRTDQRTRNIVFPTEALENSPDNYRYGQATESWRHETVVKTSGYGMGVAIGNGVILGEVRTGSFVIREGYTYGIEPPEAVTLNYMWREQGGVVGTVEPDPPGWVEVNATGHVPWSGSFVALIYAQRRCKTTSFTGVDYKTWVLVIPTGDAEAVYIPTYEYTSANGAGYNEEIRGGRRYVQQAVYMDWDGNSYPDLDTQPMLITPWSVCWDTNGPILSTSTSPPAPGAFNVYCWNPYIRGVTGTPSVDYSGLFVVSKYYPFFDPGMSSLSSSGGHYIGSEGVSSSPLVKLANRFVGWA